MKPETARALADYLLGLADDELILSHRNSEWTGHAPILEEDIAFTNLALDELGHAALWYARHAELLGENPETRPDELVYLREPAEFRNVQMVELPKGDWAFSMLRQFLFDAAESVRLEGLVGSHYPPIAEAAAKIRQEECYHLRHTSAWVRRLGLGTEESHRRMQSALDLIYPFALELFQPADGQAQLAEQGYLPAEQPLLADWRNLVRQYLAEADLIVPQHAQSPASSRAEHTGHLAKLLQEMQVVARSDQRAVW